MDDRGDLLLGEDPIQQGLITNIPLIEQGFLPADGRDPGQHAALAVAQIVHYHGFHARRLQGKAGMAADIAATAGDQYFHPLLHTRSPHKGKPEQESSRGVPP
ncbi:hypothetical protein D3C79_891910 [compost metagenome]